MPQSRKISVILFLVLIYSNKDYSQTRTEIFAQISGRNSGYFLKEEFKKQTSLESIQWVDINHAEIVRTDSFNILVIRNYKVIFHAKNKGSKFQKNILDFLNHLVVGDKVLFLDIYANDRFSKQSRYLGLLEYIIN